MASGAIRWSTSAAAASVIGAAVATATGQPAADPTSPEKVSLSLDCVLLADEARSELEARLRADLAVRGQTSGSVKLVCDGNRATISWQPSQQEPRTETIELPASPSALPERLLEAITGLVDRPEETPPVAERPVASPNVPSPPPRRLRTPEPAERPTASEPQRSLLWAVAGLNGEFWSPFAASAWGPRAGLRVAPSNRVSVTSIVGLRLGVALPNELSATTFDAQLTTDVAFDPMRHFEAGIGASVSRLTVDASSDVSPQSQRALITTGLLRARYVLHLDGFDVMAGPELRGRFGAVQIQVDGAEAFHIPVVTLAVAVEVALAL